MHSGRKDLIAPRSQTTPHYKGDNLRVKLFILCLAFETRPIIENLQLSLGPKINISMWSKKRQGLLIGEKPSEPDIFFILRSTGGTVDQFRTPVK